MDVAERKRETTISEEEILNKVRQKGTPHQASEFRCWRTSGASVGDLILFSLPINGRGNNARDIPLASRRARRGLSSTTTTQSAMCCRMLNARCSSEETTMAAVDSRLFDTRAYAPGGYCIEISALLSALSLATTLPSSSLDRKSRKRCECEYRRLAVFLPRPLANGIYAGPNTHVTALEMRRSATIRKTKGTVFYRRPEH